MIRARYFVRRPTGAPWYVFRILPDVRVQVYDVAGHSWRPEPLEPLYRWAVVDGEMGVDEIDEATAREIIRYFHRRAPRPTLNVFDRRADTPQFRLVE